MVIRKVIRQLACKLFDVNVIISNPSAITESGDAEINRKSNEISLISS